MEKYSLHIPRADYMRDTLAVARDVLLGSYLCTNIGGHFCCGKITELEAYMGDIDRASHAYPNKKTPRNSVMFGVGGHVYMYLIYGIYPMFNIVVGARGTPHAILVRSLEPVEGIETMKRRRAMNDIKNLANGPGKLTVAMGLNCKHYGADLTESDTVWLSPKTGIVAARSGKRVGIDYAGADKDLPWRFVIKGNPHISKQI
jgi:DNA-3-methyladenine glycosylase